MSKWEFLQNGKRFNCNDGKLCNCSQSWILNAFFLNVNATTAWRKSRRYCYCHFQRLSTTLGLSLSLREIVNNIVIVILRDCQHQRKPADLKTTSSIMGSHHQWSLKSGTNSKQRQHGLDKENSPAQFSFPFTFKNFSDPSTSQTRFFLSFSHQSWRLRVSFSLRESRRPSPRSRNLCFVCHPL